MTTPAGELDSIVADIVAEMTARPERGKVADYIPELARVDANAFGLVVVGSDGHVAAAGDVDVPFSIQSVSKVFTLTLALGLVGDRLWQRVGREPSGSPFNSIVQLERERGVPRNPFINAGAIAVTDVILSGHKPREVLGDIVRFMRFLANDSSIVIDDAVAASEQRTGFRNIALANYMKSFGVIDNPVEYTLGVYFHHCAIAMSCRQLAMAGRFLAHDGTNPRTGLTVVSPERARRINAVMLTCGHYDGSGEFAYRVGLPGKSGVGGGILAIAPGKASIAVWSPGLDAQGNPLLGQIALEKLTKRMGLVDFRGLASQRHRFLTRFASLTPAPPPFSGMNSTPAFSRAACTACRTSSDTLAPLASSFSSRLIVGNERPAASARSV